MATFPCASQWETCVGGTEGGYAVGDTETAASFTGGGFSRHFPTAPYQTAFVRSYLKTPEAKKVDPSMYNATGRAFPDVAAMAVNFIIVDDGLTKTVAGTSAATPTFAGIVGLLNDRRVAKGRPPLGFLNPLLYSNPNAFHDVVSGNNPGCGTDGFYAAKGYDPLTGLGTPNFAKLAAVVDALP